MCTNSIVILHHWMVSRSIMTHNQSQDQGAQSPSGLRQELREKMERKKSQVLPIFEETSTRSSCSSFSNEQIVNWSCLLENLNKIEIVSENLQFGYRFLGRLSQFVFQGCNSKLASISASLFVFVSPMVKPPIRVLALVLVFCRTRKILFLFVKII